MASMIYICASPLVKIFLPEWEDRLLDQPDLIHDTETPFEFSVNSGTTSYVIAFNTPQEVKASDFKTGLNIYNWLTGGVTGATSRDTDCYGIVQFDPQIDMLKTFDQMIMLDAIASGDTAKAKKAKEANDKAQKEAREAIRKTHEHVRRASEARILRHLRFNHNNIMKQWQIADESKQGRHQPSTSEMMGFKALSREIAAVSKKGESVKALANEMMKNPNM